MLRGGSHLKFRSLHKPVRELPRGELPSGGFTGGWMAADRVLLEPRPHQVEFFLPHLVEEVGGGVSCCYLSETGYVFEYLKASASLFVRSRVAKQTPKSGKLDPNHSSCTFYAFQAV